MNNPSIPSPQKSNTLIELGGSLGIAACAIGMAIFMGACVGFEKSFALSPIPLLMGAAGLVITVVGGVRRHGGVEQTPIVAGLFLNVFALVGGLLEIALWQNWAIFYQLKSNTP